MPNSAAGPEPRRLDQALRENIRDLRRLEDMTQRDLAARMKALGFSQWGHTTVSDVERGQRAMSADELLGLALALDTHPADLLDPEGIAPMGRPRPSTADLVLGSLTLSTAEVSQWLVRRTWIALHWTEAGEPVRTRPTKADVVEAMRFDREGEPPEPPENLE